MKRFTTNSAYNVTANLFRFGASLFTIPLLYLSGSPALYGDWIFVNSLMMTLLFVEGGVTSAISITLAQHPDRTSSVRRSHLVFLSAYSVGVAMLVAVAWTGLRQAYTPSVPLEVPMALAGAIVVVRLTAAYFIGYAQSLSRYDIVMQYSVLSSACFIFLGSGVFLVTHSIAWLLAANLVSLLVGTRVLTRGQPAYAPMAAGARPYRMGMFRDYLTRAASLWAVSASEVAFTYLSRLLVGVQGGPVILANFGLVTTIGAQIVILASSPAQTLVPVVASGRPLPVAEFMAFVRRTATLAGGLAGLIFVGVVPLLALLGGRYTGGAGELLMGVVIYAVIAMNSPGYFVLIGLRRTGILVAVGTAMAGVCLLLLRSWVHPGTSHAIVALAPYALTVVYIPVALKLMKETFRDPAAA